MIGQKYRGIPGVQTLYFHQDWMIAQIQNRLSLTLPKSDEFTALSEICHEIEGSRRVKLH